MTAERVASSATRTSTATLAPRGRAHPGDHPVLALQRSVGNAAVTTAIQRHHVGLDGWDDIEPLSLQRTLLPPQRFKGGDAIPTMEKVGAKRFEQGLDELESTVAGRLKAYMAEHGTKDLFTLRNVAVADDAKPLANRLIQNATDKAEAAGFASSYRSGLELLDRKLKGAVAEPPADATTLNQWIASVLSTIRKRADSDDLARIDQLNKAPDWQAKSVVADAWCTEATAAAAAVKRVMDDIVSSLQTAAIPEAKQLSPELRAYAAKVAKDKGVARFGRMDDAAKKDLIAEAGRAWAATEGVAAKQQQQHFAGLTKRDLLTLPTINAIYKSSGTFKTDRKVYERLTAARQKKGVAIDARWNDPVVKECDGKLEDGKVAPDEKKNVTPAADAAKAKVKTAWVRVQAFVEPEVLAKIPPPEVFMVRRVGRAQQRAMHMSPNGPIFGDASISVPVIAHETGHHLEQIGNGESWVSRQGLAYGRLDTLKTEGARTRKGGGGGAEPTLTHIPEQGPDEVAFPVPSPAEGAIDGSKFTNASYTFKYYEHSGGGGEVMSMAMQWLSDPDTCKKFIDKDPSHAASVLYHAIPQEFAAAGLAPPVVAKPAIGPVDPSTVGK